MNKNIGRAVIIAVSLLTLGMFALGPLGLLNPFQAASSAAPTAAPATPDGLPRSAPTRLTIASIGVSSTLQTLGLDRDGTTMQLPPNPKQAGWYKLGATPGQDGPTIITGYIASAAGPGVFHRLAGLRKNDTIQLKRTDGRTVTYRVTRIVSYPKDTFPTNKVFTSSPVPTLRLITTGGSLHPKQKPGNVVVYADQISVQPGPRTSSTPGATRTSP